jgi:alpha-mannosidase
LENARYRVTVNDAGDIAACSTKMRSRVVGCTGALAFQTENPREYPHGIWIGRTAKNRTRGMYASSEIRLVESGPVRVAIEVERETENSVFVQSIRCRGGCRQSVEVSIALIGKARLAR